MQSATRAVISIYALSLSIARRLKRSHRARKNANNRVQFSFGAAVSRLPVRVFPDNEAESQTWDRDLVDKAVVSLTTMHWAMSTGRLVSFNHTVHFDCLKKALNNLIG